MEIVNEIRLPGLHTTIESYRGAKIVNEMHVLQDYFTYVREHIYEPAQMHDTDAYEMDRSTPNLALGYTHLGSTGGREEGPRRNNLLFHPVKGSCWWGIFNG